MSAEASDEATDAFDATLYKRCEVGLDTGT